MHRQASYSVSGGTSLALALTATGSNDDSVHASGTGSASKLAASYAMGDLTLSASVANEASVQLKMTALLVSDIRNG